ncbi:MAG: hypothetical protein QOH20_2123, partial [Mycobacterium sp.]|nr:hypothetical protein [Mycobacterium sp.]
KLSITSNFVPAHRSWMAEPPGMGRNNTTGLRC